MSLIVLLVLSRCETDQCSREMIASSTPKPSRYDNYTSLFTRCRRLVRTIFPIIFIGWEVQVTGLKRLGFMGCVALGTGPTHEGWVRVIFHRSGTFYRLSVNAIRTSSFPPLGWGVGLWCDSCWEQIKITRIKKGTQRPDQTQWDHPNTEHYTLKIVRVQINN